MTDLMSTQSTYQEHGYCVVKGFIPRYFANYLKEILNTLKINNQLQHGDGQVDKSLVVYGDDAFDTFAYLSAPMLSNIIGVNLSFTYTYSRIYFNNAELLPHTDRPECQHSVTLFLGGTYTHLWPILIQNKNGENISVILEEGDCLIYQGDKLTHWRESFQGTDYYQLFMHYVDSEGEFKNRKFDGRPYFGIKKY